MEVSHIYQDKKKVYFVRVGIFKEGTERVTVWDQIQKCTSLEFQHGIRAAQKALIKGVAYESMEPLSLSSCFSSEALSVGNLTEKGLKEQNQPMSEHSFYMDSATSNLKNILQLHLFDRNCICLIAYGRVVMMLLKFGTALIREN